MADQQFLELMARKLADEGKLVEAGWMAFRVAFLPGAPPDVLARDRLAFMAGAQHLFASIMAMMEPGEMETPNDLRRMDLINAELAKFTEEMALMAARPAGAG